MPRLRLGLAPLQCQAGGASGVRSSLRCRLWLSPILRPSGFVDRPAWLDRSVASPPLKCAHRPVRVTPHKETQTMVIFGIDAHKRTHTVVAVDETGRQLACRTFTTTTAAHLELLSWAETVSERGSGRWRT